MDPIIHNPCILNNIHAGDSIWHRLSGHREVWRLGYINKFDTNPANAYPYCYIGKTPTDKNPLSVHYSQIERAFPATIFSMVPKSTNHLIGLNLAEWNYRASMHLCFDILECTNRYQTKGTLFGYMIIPCYLYKVKECVSNPAFKIWIVEPNILSLFKWLGDNMSEVIQRSLTINACDE